FGLAGLFGDALRSKKKLALSLVFVSAIRLISSTLSGIILWGSSIAYASSQVELGEEAPNLATRIFAFVGESLWLYSLSYNFIYIFTTTLTVMIISFLTLKRIKMIFEPMIGQPLQK
ncbi:MAG TPA: hypothetical protein DHV05_06395, partial [Acholeplasmataceae bacterium]|nr:hypothetical protein [Acholeplasmataceae bacterium]